MISEEKFMKWFKEKRIIEMLKIRGSIGEIGDDNAGSRWAYITNWEVTNNAKGFNVSVDGGESPFVG